MTEQQSEEVREVFAQVDESIASTDAVVDRFRRTMSGTDRSVRDAQASVDGFDRSIGRGLRSAFDTIVYDGERATDALRNMAVTISNSVLTSALTPVQNAIGMGIGTALQAGVGGAAPGAVATAMADGGVLTSGRVRAFARGGVVQGPTLFPMRRGSGLMGEAGPEAILPLSRGPDGSLGVRSAAGGGAVNVVMHISTPDAEGFRKSRGQISAELSRAIGRGRRNL